eukprot:s2424_g4.t1
MQVADIPTKPFANAKKWRFALALMSHVATKGRSSPNKKPESASPGERRPKALAEPGAGPMVEICCNPLPKLSDVSRESASGCRVVQLTERHNLLDSDYRQYVANIVNEFPVQKAVILYFVHMALVRLLQGSRVSLVLALASLWIVLKMIRGYPKGCNKLFRALTKGFSVSAELQAHMTDAVNALGQQIGESMKSMQAQINSLASSRMPQTASSTSAVFRAGSHQAFAASDPGDGGGDDDDDDGSDDPDEDESWADRLVVQRQALRNGTNGGPSGDDPPQGNGNPHDGFMPGGAFIGDEDNAYRGKDLSNVPVLIDSKAVIHR